MSAPPSEEMIRGGLIHSVMEDGFLKGPNAIAASAIEHGVTDDPAIVALEYLIHQIAHDLGSFVVIEAEVKHQVYEEYEGKNIVWVGMIDGLIRVEGLGLIIVELKTGKMNMGKLSRTRKELIYYRRMLELMEYNNSQGEEPTHLLYISPDYQTPEMGYDKLLGTGVPSQAYKITISAASAKAVEKVEAAGGEVING